MNRKSRSIFRASLGLALLLAAGCSNNSKSSPPPKATPSQDTNAAAAPAKPEPAPVVAAPAPTPTPTAAEPVNSESARPVVQLPTKQSAQPPAAGSDDERREQAANLIYAQIRVKMEDAIDERAKLLKGGTDPADPKVRELEGRIMRARELLMGNGELVEDVEPPIVQKNP